MAGASIRDNTVYYATFNTVIFAIQKDPHRTVSSLTAAQKATYRNQTIPTLSELAKLSQATGISLMFDVKMAEDVKEGLLPHHPYNETFMDVIINALLESGMPQENVSVTTL